MLARMAHRPRLLHRLLRSANQILLLPLHPKMRRIIGQIRENCHERRGGQAVAQRAIEVGDQRNHQVTLALLPEFLEQPHLAAVIEAYQAVHQHGGLRRTEGPAFLQHHVVDVLHPDASVLAENIEGVENFLEIYQADFPLPSLLLDDGLQGVGSRPVPAASVKEDEVQALQRQVPSNRCGPSRGTTVVLSKEQFVTVTYLVKNVLINIRPHPPEIISSTECNGRSAIVG